ncbi:hypothetical protein Tco_1498908 [Tanacetum coccineum]
MFTQRTTFTPKAKTKGQIEIDGQRRQFKSSQVQMKGQISLIKAFIGSLSIKGHVNNGKSTRGVHSLINAPIDAQMMKNDWPGLKGLRRESKWP